MLQCFARETSVLWNMVMLILLLAAPAEKKKKYCGVLLPVEGSEWSGHKIIQQEDVFP